MSDFNKLPPEMVALVKEIEIYDVTNPDDYYWEKEYGIDDFCCAATGGDGTISFWGTGAYSPNIVPHEVAHCYDTAYTAQWGVTGDRISTSQVWLDAMASDEAATGLNGVTDYARNSNSSVEDFAEAVALYYTNPSALDQFPARKALLEQYLP